MIRKGVRALMQQVAQIERERVSQILSSIYSFLSFLIDLNVGFLVCVQDDLKASLGQMKKQLNEASDLQAKSDEKLSHALQNLRALQDEKSNLETKLGQKQAALQAEVKMDEKKKVLKKLSIN